jgi:hypothetical protein
MDIKSSNIAKEFVVFSPDMLATTVMFTPTVFDELDKNYHGLKATS